MHRRHMITISAVLSLQLPIAVVDVAGRAAQDFESVGCLVNHHVDDLRGLCEMFGQWLHIRVEASGQQTAIGLEPRDLLQIVRAFLVELLGITGAVRIFYLQQLSGIAECPTVKWTGKCRLAAALVTAKRCATMTAGIDEGVELIVLAAGDKDGLSSHPGCEIIVLVRNLTLMREIHPVSLKQVLHLQLKEPGIGKYRTIATKHTVGRILDQRCIETFNDA